MLNCHVFANREHLSRLETPRTIAGHQAASLTLHAVASHEPISSEALRQAQFVILQVDPKDEFSLARMEQVRRERPHLPIIAAIEESDIKLTRALIRQGVFDVVTLPFDAEEVLSRVMDASATVAAQSNVELAPMVAVVGAAGGTGATTVITHLASALSGKDRSRRCCIVDLDLQFGEVANYLGLSAAVSVLELLEAGDRLDSDLVRNAAVDSGRGAFVLAAPQAISPLEAVDLDRLLRLLDITRQEFDFVLLDLPSSWTNWSLSALLASSGVVLLTDQTINGLRQAKRCLELFKSVEVSTDDLTVVVNRFEKRLMQKINLGDVIRVLDQPVVATLALEKGGLSTAQDQGQLINEVSRKSRFFEDVSSLAALLDSALGIRA